MRGSVLLALGLLLLSTTAVAQETPARPRSHARRPRQGLAGLPDRLGTLEERHPGPRVRGLCAVYVRAAAGGRTGPAGERAVFRAHVCGFRAAGGAKVFPSGPPPDQNRPRPARSNFRPGTPPSSARAGSSRSAAPLRPAQAPKDGTRSGAGTSRTRSAGAARRQPGRRRRRLPGESPDRKSEPAGRRIEPARRRIRAAARGRLRHAERRSPKNRARTGKIARSPLRAG